MSERSEPVLVTAVGGGDKRRLKVLLGVAVVLVLLLVVVPKFLGGGGGDDAMDDLDLGGPAAGAQPVGPAPVETAADELGITDSYSDRDPFLPLITPEVAAPADDPALAAGSTSGEAVPVPPEGGTVVDDGTAAGAADPVWLPVPPVTDPAPEEPVAPPAPTPTSQRFAVLEVQRALDGRPSARVRVDDAVMDVIPVQDFAGSFRVLSVDVDTRCGQFLFGDVTFVLCEGQEITT